MQEGSALIDVLDTNGKVLGQKRRDEIDRTHDIVRMILILLFNAKNELFLTQPTESAWPGQWASSAAGLVRHGEQPEAAARRTLVRELGLHTPLQSLGEKYYNFQGVRRYMTVFYGTTPETPLVCSEDANQTRWVTLEETEALLGSFTPTLQAALALLKNKSL